MMAEQQPLKKLICEETQVIAYMKKEEKCSNENVCEKFLLEVVIL